MPGLGLYLGAFFDLDAERSHSFGPTAIPTTAILTYAMAFKFDHDQKEDLLYFIREMDKENLKLVKAKQAKPKTGK